MLNPQLRYSSLCLNQAHLTHIPGLYGISELSTVRNLRQNITTILGRHWTQWNSQPKIQNNVNSMAINTQWKECRVRAILAYYVSAAWVLLSMHYLIYKELHKSPGCRVGCYRDILENIATHKYGLQILSTGCLTTQDYRIVYTLCFALFLISKATQFGMQIFPK